MLLLALALALSRDPSPAKAAASNDPIMLAAGPAPMRMAPMPAAPTSWLPVAGTAGPGGQYAAPRLPYAAPRSQYAAPRSRYAAPQSQYAAPRSQQGNPQSQVHWLNFAPSIFQGATPPHADRGKDCTRCHDIKPVAKVAGTRAWSADAQSGASTITQSIYQGGYANAPVNGQPPCATGGQVAATAQAQTNVAPQSPTRQQAQPAMLPFQEAHWQGIEAISLSPGLARVLGMPRRSQGVVIDEVTMPADVQGFAAGDLITGVGRRNTPDLEAFVDAADRVRDNSHVVIDVMRKGEAKKVVLSARRLGTASGETAPMIPAGARAPHGYQGPCTNCHRIGTGGSLAVDLGDVLSKSAPSILWGQTRPHQDRGACTACHTIR